jgi:uncharacterized protein with HEPN domain
MRRDLLLLGEMIQAADRAHELTRGLTLQALQDDRLRSESLLWNFTVLGEAAAHLSGEIKEHFPDIAWRPVGGVTHGCLPCPFFSCS